MSDINKNFLDEVNGRNLIPNSKNGVMLHPNNTRINHSYIETTDEYKTVYNEEEASILSTYTPVLLELPAGTYTDSVDVWSPVEINLSLGSGEKTNIKPNEWTRISETREHNGGTYRVLGLFSDEEQNAINGVRYRNYKTEKGTLATDWTPAPEDINSKKYVKNTRYGINKILAYYYPSVKGSEKDTYLFLNHLNNSIYTTNYKIALCLTLIENEEFNMTRFQELKSKINHLSKYIYSLEKLIRYTLENKKYIKD